MARAGRWMGVLAVSLVAVGCGGGSSTCQDGQGGSACTNTSDPTAVVSNLSLRLSAQSVNNTGSETITATVTATNANSQTMEGAAVLLSVDNGAQIAVDGAATGSDGTLVGTVGVGDNRSNRTVTVTASANDGALKVSKTFQVVGAALSGTPVPAVIEPGDAGEVQFRLLDANSNPMSDVAIVITGPGGEESTGTTGSNGEYVFAYTAPASTGSKTITAEAGGDSASVGVLVQASGSGSIPDVPASLNVQSGSISANPSVVPVNSESTSNQSQIRVLFVSESNAPVPNMRVRFDLNGDVNSIGGSFTTGRNLVYTNDSGVATTSYVPGTRASPTDGVTIRACYDKTDFPAVAASAADPVVGSAQCPHAVLVKLTVINEAVSVSIGTNNLIERGADDLTYVKRYVVQVVDSSGLAKSGVQISPSIDLLRYIKGHYEVIGDFWQKVGPITDCDNEDLNRNNTYEVYAADGHDEDVNGSFNLTAGRPALEPRKADVAISFEGSSTTNSSGTVVLRIEYPQDLGSWVEFNLLVAASGVSATEGRANYNGILPVPGDVISDTENEPPFVVSPYGVQAGSPVNYTFEGTTYSLCTNPN